MKKYMVTVPIVGYSYVDVEADSKEEAQDIAIEKCCKFDDENVELQELYGIEEVVKGNACFHPCWNIEIEEDND